jgi:hypothetical protein
MMRRAHGRVSAVALIALGLLGQSCRHAPPRFKLGEVLLIRVVPGAEELSSNAPLDIEIRIANHSGTAAHFGDERSAPWLQVTRIDDFELTDTWIGHGESIPSFEVRSGESLVLRRRLRLDDKRPGKYLVHLDAKVKECELPIVDVPAFVRLLPAREQPEPRD